MGHPGRVGDDGGKGRVVGRFDDGHTFEQSYLGFLQLLDQ